MPYQYSIGLQGHAKKDRRSYTFDLGEPLDHVSAQNAANQIRGALVAITKAFVRYERLTEILSEDGTRPSDTSADCFEECRITTYLDATGDKLHNIKVYAPIDTMFLPDGETLDTANAAVIQYVQQLSQHAFVSDGESINTTVTDGIKEGWKASSSRSFK